MFSCEPKNTKLIILALFQKRQILGCYNSTTLKMNLVLEIRKMMIKEIVTFCLHSILIFPSYIFQ
jgi:hypothetical protein